MPKYDLRPGDPATHPLIARAVATKVAGRTEPEEATYDLRRGIWIDDASGLPVVEADDDRRPRPPRTKKADIETGEDAKGE